MKITKTKSNWMKFPAAISMTHSVGAYFIWNANIYRRDGAVGMDTQKRSDSNDLRSHNTK
jgi:hypothetical protein